MLSAWNRSLLLRYVLRHPLMWPCLVEVSHIGMEDALEVLLLKDQQVIETLLPHAPQEAFADCIGAGSVIGRLENLNPTRGDYPSKARPKFIIVITNQVLGCLPIGSR